MTDNLQSEPVDHLNDTPMDPFPDDPFRLLEHSLIEALKTYSNVHRGSGHKSIATTALFEHARLTVLEYLGLNSDRHIVFFCTPGYAAVMEKKLQPGKYHILSSESIGLSIGIRAFTVKKGFLPQGIPPQSGGGTTKLISTEWVIWAPPPARFEPGTPPVINIIAFSRALQLTRRFGDNAFKIKSNHKQAPREILYAGSFEGMKGKVLLEELRKTRAGLDLKVPTMDGERNFINLDSSASSKAQWGKPRF